MKRAREDEPMDMAGHPLEDALCDACFIALTLEDVPAGTVEPCTTPKECNEILTLYVTHIQQYMNNNK